MLSHIGPASLVQAMSISTWQGASRTDARCSVQLLLRAHIAHVSLPLRFDTVGSEEVRLEAEAEEGEAAGGMDTPV